MVLLLKDVLNAEAIVRLRQGLAYCDSGPPCRMGDIDAAADDPATRVLVQALRDHPLFLLGVRPRHLSRVHLTRFEPGMEQSGSADAENAVMHSATLRADIRVTAFLSKPDEYEGGELCIDTGYGEENYKEEAGSCLAYPATAQRHICPVTRGERWGAELIVQSTIRDHEQRDILYTISCAEHYLKVFHKGTQDDREQVRRCHDLLLQLWAEY
jgi:PKHD-type hydroxylase